MLSPISLNPKARVTLRYLGQEKNPVLVIDDVFSAPEQLVDLARKSDFQPPNGTYYPGGNAPLPRAYHEALLAGLKPSLSRAFQFAPETAYRVHGFLALATTPLSEFGPYQKIPHYDQPSPRHLAMVHYLNHQKAQGTGFFRHEATGFETVSEARRDHYIATVAEEIKTSPPEGYCGPQTANYAMTGAVEMRFNRMVIYQAHLLHCALFEGVDLSPDPARGRLTANSFFEAV